MIPGQRFAAAAATVWGAVAAVFGPTPGAAAPSFTAPAPPAAFTLRYSAQGWVGLTQAGAAQVKCDGDDAACGNGTAATDWVDTDDDDATVNSTSAQLTIPAGAAIGWAGLYWAGDRGTRSGDAPARCDAAAEGTPPATPPPASDRTNQISVKVDSGRYAVVTASALADVTSPAGGTAFQAYADITALLRPHQTPEAPRPVRLTVANLQVAHGPDCVGGWTAILAYNFPAGPDPTNAPAYRGVAVFDGVVATADGVLAEIRLDGLQTPTEDALDAHLAMALQTSGSVDGLELGGVALKRPDGEDRRGYRRAAVAVPGEALRPGATGATVRIDTGRSAFVAGVFGVTHRLPATVDLAVSTTVAPTSAPVGGEATLTVTVRNEATLPASGVVVTARLPTGLTLIQPVEGYDAESGAWSVGRVAAGGTAALSLRVRVAQAGGLTTTAEVTASELPDVDSTPGDGRPAEDDVAFVTLTGTEQPPSPTTDPLGAAAPPGSEPPVQILPFALFGVGLFLLGVLMFSIVVLRNRMA